MARRGTGKPDWSYNSHSLACALRGRRGIFYFLLNAYWQALEFELPPLPTGARGGWRRVIDTALESPADLSEWDQALEIRSKAYHVHPRSVALLVAEGDENQP